MQKYGVKDTFLIIDDGDLADSLYVQFNSQLDGILVIIDQPECDCPYFIFDQDRVSTYNYLQKWFRTHDIFKHLKTIELWYPKLNTSDLVKMNREALNEIFGEDFLKNDEPDLNYIRNEAYLNL